jgi:cell division protein FtsB
MKILIAILSILLALLQYRLWFCQGSVKTVVVLKKQVAVQQAQNTQLKDRNQVLLAEVQDLQKGHQAVEERARSELGMIKKGEIFYQVVK